MDKIHAIYEKMPPTIQSILASAHGYKLLRWRYGAQTERLVNQALERETYTPEQWRSYQEERLSLILHRAVTSVPYYKELWSKRCQRGDKTSWKYLENWPVLEKEHVRANPKSFIIENCDTTKMWHDQTSGSTGTPLNLWSSKQTEIFWYALAEARWRKWYGVSRDDRWALLGGQPIVPSTRQNAPFWVWNAAFHQLYMSAKHISARSIPFYINALKKFRIKYIYGYSSSITLLAKGILYDGKKDLNQAVIITNAEPLYEHQRKIIEDAFQCPVRETYGTAEKIAAASQCNAGKMHIWPEVGILEVMNGSDPLPPGNVGDFINTTLINDNMILVRYRIGDRGSLRKENGMCQCGRTLPAIDSIEGRTNDVQYTPDGRHVWGLICSVFKGLPIHEGQIIQEKIDLFRVRVVPALDYSGKTRQIITERLLNPIGPIKVLIEETDCIPREKNGKFKAVICKIPPEERPSIVL
jgi:phenylacetate-CoA ligase